LEPRPGYETKADFIKGVLLKDQQPIFPVGIIGHSLQSRLGVGGCVDDDESLFQYLAKDIGLNTLVRSTNTNVPAFMRLAEKYGLNVITWTYSQGSPKLGYPMSMLAPPRSDNLPLEERLKIQRASYDEGEATRTAETKLLRDYKNFIGYYNFDEPNLINPDERIAIAEWYWKTVKPWILIVRCSCCFPGTFPTATIGRAGAIFWDMMSIPVLACPASRATPAYIRPTMAYNLRERCRRDNKLMWFIPLANQLDPGRSPIGMNKAHLLCKLIPRLFMAPEVCYILR